MKLLDQFRTAQGTKMAQDIATSFLGGFAGAAVILITPDLNLADPGRMIQSFYRDFTNPVWVYLFFNTCLGAAFGTAFGLRLKSAFDSLSAKYPFVPSNPPITGTDLKDK